MALPARLTTPQEEREVWPWHQARWTSISASLMFARERRMEAENYLVSGYGIRLAMEARGAGWTSMENLAPHGSKRRIQN